MGTRKNIQLDELLNQIKNLDHTDLITEIELSQKLLSSAKSCHDPYGMSFAYLHLSQAYLSLGNFSESLSYSLKGISLQKTHHFDDLLLIQDNVLAVILSNQGDEQYALKYMFEALSIAKEKNDYLRMGATVNNIGSLFSELKDYDTAIEYFKMGSEYSKKAATNKDANVFPIEVSYINLASVYCYKGKTLTARKYLDRCCRKLSPELYAAYEANIEIIRAQIAYQEGNQQQAYESACIAYKNYQSSNYVLEAFPAYIELVDLFLSIDRIEEAGSILQRCCCLPGLDELPSKSLMICDRYIKYYIKTNNTKQLALTYPAFYEQQQKQNSVMNAVRSASVHTRLKLEHMESEHVKLISLSQEDELTSLYNRHGLRALVDTRFEQACKTGTAFGLIMIDVDYFKEFNDYYGHLEGDDCLRQIAKVMTTVVNARGYLTRYGGDEFCLLFENLSDSEIKEIGDSICQAMNDLHFPHADSPIADYVTLSIGAVNYFPDLSTPFFDYLHTADDALYEAKHLGRNCCIFRNELA